ncbi:MAG: hypothetical protein IPM29_26370 [Planctomycetes bacterium]|nr:hypothetical protein [Planctomycetota bacterium]
MDFLQLREREREPLRRLAVRNRDRVQELHVLMAQLGERGVLGEPRDEIDRLRGERAVTIAYMTDREHLRTLLRAERWLEERLAQMEDPATDLPGHFLRRAGSWSCRGGRPHRVVRWLADDLGDRRVSRRGRGNFVRSWFDGDDELRDVVRVWSTLPDGVTPFQRGLEIARRIYATRNDIARELAALRAIQTMSVLDVRNYRTLVFELGNYAADGEDRDVAEALP